MKIVFQTQIRENYGAHDWDGEGACPQYWKYKGGNTYVVNCDLTQAMDKAFWERASNAVTEDGDYFEEYVLSSESLVANSRSSLIIHLISQSLTYLQICRPLKS